MIGLHDAHCHIDFSPQGEAICLEAEKAGARLFVNTVTPSGYERADARFGRFGNVVVGVGCHPWWVSGLSDEEILRAAELSADARYVGEIGLDFGRKGMEPERQLEAFERIMRECASAGGKTVSLHAVKAAGAVLDILRDTDAFEGCTCIFHWFSGASEDLRRAIDAGCFFSVNPMMASSRRGKEYIRQIPAQRLLLETDIPGDEGDACSFGELEAALRDSLDAISSIKGEAANEIVLANGHRVLSMMG